MSPTSGTKLASTKSSLKKAKVIGQSKPTPNSLVGEVIEPTVIKAFSKTGPSKNFPPDASPYKFTVVFCKMYL